MNRQTDARLLEALRELQPPPADETHRERVRAAVARAAAEDGRLARPYLRPRSFRQLWRRPALRLGVVAAAVVVAVGAALLFGPTRTTGPETVTAAEILHKALLAVSSGRTFQATVEMRSTDWDMWGEGEKVVVERYRLTMAADGSYHVAMIGPSGEPLRVKPYEPCEVGDTGEDQDDLVAEAYDAGTSTLRELRLERGLIEHRHVAPGPPDRLPGALGAVEISTVARALEAAGGAVVRSTRYDEATGRLGFGRPAWVITSSVSSGPSHAAVGEYGSVVRLTIDQETALPLRFAWLQSGVLMFEVRQRDILFDRPLAADAFRLDRPAGVAVHRMDDGFREIDLDDAAELAGYVTLAPDDVPTGYALTEVAAAPSSTTFNGLVHGRRVFALNYRRGFEYLTVTTRHVDDPEYVADVDPFDFEQSWSKMMRHEVKLSAGAFEGATARILFSYKSTTPHLWAVKDGVLLTVGGGASEEELVAVAESLRVIRP